MPANGILLNGQFFDFDAGVLSLPAELRLAIAARLLNPPPARHAEPSMILSLDDEPARPSQRLFDLAAKIAAESPTTTHPLLRSRHGIGPRWFEVFPGEHYHLLTTLARVLKARTVWEFGTDTGMGTVALLEGMEQAGTVYTVDLDAWTSKSGPWLVAEDFRSGRVIQVVSDMKAPELFHRHGDCIANAELIVVDGPKDGVTEAAFLERLSAIDFRTRPIVLFDDIRVMNMLAIWRQIRRPKMDLTSFGHWSGTGLIDWNGAGAGAGTATARASVPPGTSPSPR